MIRKFVCASFIIATLFASEEKLEELAETATYYQEKYWRVLNTSSSKSERDDARLRYLLSDAVYYQAKCEQSPSDRNCKRLSQLKRAILELRFESVPSGPE